MAEIINGQVLRKGSRLEHAGIFWNLLKLFSSFQKNSGIGEFFHTTKFPEGIPRNFLGIVRIFFYILGICFDNYFYFFYGALCCINRCAFFKVTGKSMETYLVTKFIYKI